MNPRVAQIGSVLFWLVWAWDGLLSLVILYFFFAGLADGSVSSFNMLLWLGILAVVGLVMLGSLVMQLKKWTIPALILVLLMAVPGCLIGLFFLILIVANPRWN
jgi:hypothetical protein